MYFPFVQFDKETDFSQKVAGGGPKAFREKMYFSTRVFSYIIVDASLNVGKLHVSAVSVDLSSSKSLVVFFLV